MVKMVANVKFYITWKRKGIFFIKILVFCVVTYLFHPLPIGTCAPGFIESLSASRQETRKLKSFRPDVEVCDSGRILCSLDRFRWLLFDWNVDTYTAEMAENKTKGLKAHWRVSTLKNILNWFFLYSTGLLLFF